MSGRLTCRTGSPGGRTTFARRSRPSRRSAPATKSVRVLSFAPRSPVTSWPPPAPSRQSRPESTASRSAARCDPAPIARWCSNPRSQPWRTRWPGSSTPRQQSPRSPSPPAARSSRSTSASSADRSRAVLTRRPAGGPSPTTCLTCRRSFRSSPHSRRGSTARPRGRSRRLGSRRRTS